MSHNKRLITYEEYGLMCNKLVEYLKETNLKFDCLYAVPRGGLPLGVHLSHHLNIEYCKYEIPPMNSITHLLVVDDIVDTGQSLLHCMYMLDQSKMKFVSLFYKEHSKVKPFYYVEKTEDWIVFPWETYEEEPNRCE